MTTTPDVAGVDPGTPNEPSLRDLVTASERLRSQPGLMEQTMAWQLELEGVRRALDREALHLATPRIWPDTVGALASTAGRVISAAAPDAPLALLTAAAASAGLPIAPPSAGYGTVERAQRLVRAGGPAYVKLGQFIASSHGLLPDAWVEGFAWCRDDAPPLATGIARSIVSRELGDGALRGFQEQPVAAGSIGQVHLAWLADDTPVAVKVRRPGLRRRFRRDVETLALVAAAADRWVPAVRAANLGGFVELFAGLALQELDFRLEALNAAECAAVLEHAGIDAVSVPLPIAGMTTDRILVMPFVDGVRYDEAPGRFGADLDGDHLLRTAIRAVLESTLLYGICHGDLHAGNVLVSEPDRFDLLDYGICARLDRRQRASLVRFLIAFAAADASGQVRALSDFGAFDASADLGTLTRQLQLEADALNRRDGGQVTFDRLGVTLSRLLRVFAANGFVMPAELVLFFKNLLYLSSFASSVAPTADLFAAVTSVLAELVQARPELLGQLTAVDIEHVEHGASAA